MRRVLVLGATSAIVRWTSLELARAGCPLLLAARREDELRRLAGDIEVRAGARPKTMVYDLEAPGDQMERALAFGPDALLVAVGYLGDEERALRDPEEALRIARLNYTLLLPPISRFASYMEETGAPGPIAVITSVAGVRGRSANPTYGSAKAGISTYLEALRHRGLRVLDVRPGPVDTRMIYGRVRAPLVASPKKVGEAIAKAIIRGKEGVLYLPRFWGLVALALVHLPFFVFRRIRV